MEFLPNELIISVIGFLASNKESRSLIQASKKLYRIGQERGYLKRISFPGFEDYEQHKETVDCIHVTRSLTPPAWTRSMCFTHCGYPIIFTPETKVDTKKLVYKTYERGEFRIDWKMFPNLSIVIMAVHSLVDTDFSPLTKLRLLYIKTHTGEWRKNVTDKEPRFVSITGHDDEPDVPFLAILNAVRR
uniref:F-box domain-containing protein n=1 Tax=viral metagenome TaxID=1070528 RepID=A0A6C0EM74_9ZZZZ